MVVYFLCTLTLRLIFKSLSSCRDKQVNLISLLSRQIEGKDCLGSVFINGHTKHLSFIFYGGLRALCTLIEGGYILEI